MHVFWIEVHFVQFCYSLDFMGLVLKMCATKNIWGHYDLKLDHAGFYFSYEAFCG